MLQRLLHLRIFIFIVVFFTILNGLALVAVGVALSIEGMWTVIQGKWNMDPYPGVIILKSLDTFLAALIFFIFAIGITQLFIVREEGSSPIKLPKWIQIENFTQLKLILWETVMTTLVIFFVSELIKHPGEFHWELLILPIAIILLSASIFIIRKSEAGHSH